MCIFLLLLVACPAAAQLRYVGIARDARGDVVYREEHWLPNDDPDRGRVVLYRCPDGRPFARKQLTSSGDPIAPDYDYVDARTGYREGLRTVAGGREVFWRPRAGEALRSKRLDAAPGLVADAGFDAFVRERWPQIDARGRRAPFLLPSRLAAVDLRLHDAGMHRIDGRDVRRFRLGLPGLLGLALPEVELDYDARDRRLLRFRGIGSVRDARGRPQWLRIDFPPERVRVSPTAVAEAGRTVLSRTCSG
ncbi:hypothetical protein PAGU2595_004000 [Lysobacter xanthus]